MTGATLHAPVVSVCIPTYNGRTYLSACIESVQAQTFTDFEVVVCDDQSSDGTLELARQLVAADVRFRFIANPRRFGLVGNWNNCIRQARGEWIKFLFHDDTIEPACIEKLLDACQAHHKPLGFCGRNLIFEQGTSAQRRDWFLEHKVKITDTWLSHPVIEPERAIRILAQDTELNLVGEPTATLIRKSVFAELGEFDEALIQACDLEFWFRVMTNYGAVFVPEALAAFRVHLQATTALNHSKREYRALVLDGLLVRYRLAFGRHYRSLRRRGATEKSALTRRLDCMMFAAYARRQASRRTDAGSLSGEDVFGEWRAVLLRYPRLRLLAALGTVAHHFHNLTRAIGLNASPL